MSELQLMQVENNERVKILDKLGFTLNEEGFVLDKNKKLKICKYSEEPVHINTAAILPGSVEIINANPYTMAQYFLTHYE